MASNPTKTESQMAYRTQAALIATTQPSHIADVVAITGGESPTEAEHNLLVTAINAIIAVLEVHGLKKDA